MRAISIPVTTNSASWLSLILEFNEFLFFELRKGLANCTVIHSWSPSLRILFLAAVINLVSAALEHLPELQLLSWDLQASSSGEIAGPSQGPVYSSAGTR